MESLVEAYQRRLCVPDESSLCPNLSTLESLTELHVKHIPFENISMHMVGEKDAPILLTKTALMHKVLTKRRGGCCLELNGLFSLLLKDIGFPFVRLVPCFVAAGPERGHKSSKKFRTIPSHFVLMVGIQLDGPKMDYFIVDVGLGEPPLGPLPYNVDMINKHYRTPEALESRLTWDRPWIDGSGRQKQCIILEWKRPRSGDRQDEWEPRLQWDVKDAPLDGTFPPNEHTLESFSYVIKLLVDQRSTFSRKMIVCSVTRDAKVSLSGRRLKITSPRFGVSSQCHVTELQTEQSILEALHAHFGIQLLQHEKLDLKKSDREGNSKLWDHL